MASKKYRRLNIDLPIQPSVNQAPWLMAGLLLALAVWVMSAYAYFHYNKKVPSRQEQKIKKLRAAESHNTRPMPRPFWVTQAVESGNGYL